MKRNRPDKDGSAKSVIQKLKKIIFSTQSVCALCGRPVNFDKVFPDPSSPTVDHIIPISKGGDPASLENLQLAHLQCNRIKSSKLVDPKLRELVSNRDLPLSCDWANMFNSDSALQGRGFLAPSPLPKLLGYWEILARIPGRGIPQNMSRALASIAFVCTNAVFVHQGKSPETPF